MNFKKRVNGSWTDTPHYIHKADTDILTTLPDVIYPTGTTATVGLKGQTTQSSIPSPTSPVMPQGTGDKTANLFDEEYPEISGSLKYKPIFVGDGTFTMSTSCPKVEGAAALFLLAGNVQSGASSASNGVYKDRPITVTSTSGYVTIVYRHVMYQSGSADPQNEQTMLNTGSTPLPYEKFGIKIPISSASTTTPVYLGEVETTRKIKKYEFTGLESFVAVGSGYVVNIRDAIGVDQRAVTDAICSHYQAQSYGTVYGGTRFGFAQRLGASENARGFSFSKGEIETAQDFKTYLAQQYAAGTPVTVWYVLAEPTTGIVNEPIRKIGDYADTLSNISIPVTAGGDTLSVGTTVQPSEVTVNYKGWHPVQSVHERDNGAWT